METESLPAFDEISEPDGRRTKKKWITVTAIIAIAVVGILIFMGAFEGIFSSRGPYRVNNGDYIVYSITGYYDGNWVNGTERIVVTNVSSAGYDVNVTYNNVPGSTPYTEHYPWNDSIRNSSGFVFEGSQTINTAWGIKKVDKYSYTIVQYRTFTYFVGNETGGIYREEYREGTDWWTKEIGETSVPQFWERNRA